MGLVPAIPTETSTGKPVAIGDPYQGGILAYILQGGDPGYVAGQAHGLIAAAADQCTGIKWALAAHEAVPAGTGTALGAGSANTDKIIAQNGVGSSYAAGLARACTDGGYSDWHLPSKDELNSLYLNRAAVRGLAFAGYWSSSEYDALYAWGQYFVIGYQGYDRKGSAYRVRAVRAF